MLASAVTVILNEISFVTLKASILYSNEQLRFHAAGESEMQMESEEIPVSSDQGKRKREWFLISP